MYSYGCIEYMCICVPIRIHRCTCTRYTASVYSYGWIEVSSINTTCVGIFVYWCVWMEQHQHHLYICMFTCCVCEHIDVSIHVAQHRHDLNSILVKCTSKVATTPVEIRGNSTSRHHQKVPRLYIYIYTYNISIYLYIYRYHIQH